MLDRGCPLEQPDSAGFRPLDYAVKARNPPAVQCFLRKGAKLGTTTWALARGSPAVALMLLQKLLEDGNLLYHRGRVKDASHRFNYALRKYPEELFVNGQTLTPDLMKKARGLQLKLTTGLARCKRRNGDYKDAIRLCSEAMELPELGGEEVFEARFLRAKCHFDSQDSMRARQDAEEAVNLCPASREARQLLQSLTLDGQPDSMNGVTEILIPEEGILPPGSVVTREDASQGLGLSIPGCAGTLEDASQSQISPETQKSSSPADCSSDSGNQADFEDPRLLSPSRRSLETEL